MGDRKLIALLFMSGLILTACDGEVQRLQREAEFNARFTRGAMPRVGEPRVCEFQSDKIICYPKGKPRQPQIVGYLWEIP